MKAILTLLLFLSIAGQSLVGQNTVIDSLINEIEIAESEEGRLFNMGRLGFNYLIMGDYENAIRLADETMRGADKIQNVKFYREAAVVKGNALVEIGETARAEEIYDEVEALIPADSIKLLANINRQRLMLYTQTGRHQESIDLGISILATLDDKEHRALKSYICGDLSTSFMRLKLHEEAIEFGKKKLRLVDESENSRSYLITLFNLAAQFREAKMTDSALVYLNILASDPRTSQLGPLHDAVQLTTGQVYNDLDSTKAAINVLAAMSDAMRKSRNYSAVLSWSSGLGQSYLKTGQDQDAISVLARGLEAARSIGSLDGQAGLSKQLSQAYANLSRFDSAYHYQDLTRELRDSLFTSEKLEAVKEIETRYQMAEKDAEISNQNLQIAKQENTRNGLLGSLALLGILGAALFARFRLRQKITSQNLSLQIEKNQNLLQKQKLLAIDYMVQGQEEERKRIAKDLHDGLGSLLLSARMQLSNIHQGIKALENMDLFTKAEGLIENAHEEVRRIAHNMMPEALMNFGLKEAVQDFGHQINVSSKVQVVTNFYCDTAELSEEMEVHLFRIIQEGVNNALKHADPDLITIQLSKDEEHYLLEISDDGKGFDVEEGKGREGIGLRNLESRVKYLNGDLVIASEPGQGTSIEVSVPCEL